MPGGNHSAGENRRDHKQRRVECNHGVSRPRQRVLAKAQRGEPRKKYYSS